MTSENSPGVGSAFCTFLMLGIVVTLTFFHTHADDHDLGTYMDNPSDGQWFNETNCQFFFGCRNVTYKSAVEICNYHEGGRLYEPRDNATLQYVQTKVDTLKLSPGFWIGIREVNLNYEYESDGERVLLKNWNASEVLYSSDATLTVLKLFICEFPKYQCCSDSSIETTSSTENQ